METKSKNPQDISTGQTSSDDTSVTGRTQEERTDNAHAKSHRSIREMVIDNNRRFAATMKSLGE